MRREPIEPTQRSIITLRPSLGEAELVIGDGRGTIVHRLTFEQLRLHAKHENRLGVWYSWVGYSDTMKP
jgi:hypothetical protein